jgi:hypothetical protein
MLGKYLKCAMTASFSIICNLLLIRILPFDAASFVHLKRLLNNPGANQHLILPCFMYYTWNYFHKMHPPDIKTEENNTVISVMCVNALSFEWCGLPVLRV